MFNQDSRPEWSALARLGDTVWTRVIDPLLRIIVGEDQLTTLLRLRASIQIILLVAVILLPVSLFWSTGHVLTASGLLFDIAGAARVFMLEEIEAAIGGYKENASGNIPSVAMRELIMPETHPGEPDVEASPISQFYYRKRGVLFLFIGFGLQMVGDFWG